MVAPPNSIAEVLEMFARGEEPVAAAVKAAVKDSLAALCEKKGVPLTAIGAVSNDGNLVFADLFTVSLGDLRREHERTLPELFG